MTKTTSVAFLLLLIAAIVSASNEASTEWLKLNALKEDVITLPSGLQYKVLNRGKGKFHPQVSTPTAMHYEGRTIDGTVFDSSYKRGSPSTFQPQQVVKGWTEAMQMMVEGDKFELYVPSELGYGERGSPPKIQGGDALIFIMEMIEIKGDNKDSAVNCNAMTLEDCNEKESAYVEKSKIKYSGRDSVIDEMDRIARISQHGTKATLDWANTRIKILRQLVQKADEDGEDL